MSAHPGPDDDVRDLVRHGSASWTGPSPRASGSRWAVRAARRPMLRSGLVMAAAGLAALVLGAMVAAGSESPGRAATTVVRLVSGVAPAPPPPSASPAPVVATPSPTSPTRRRDE